MINDSTDIESGLSQNSEIVVENGDHEHSDTGNNVENLAKRYGWNAEGEKSAAEFIEFALREVPERGKELKRIKKTVDDLKTHMQKQQEFANKQAIDELQQRKRIAQDNGDYTAYNNLEQQERQIVPINSEVKEAWDVFEETNADWLDVDNVDTLDMRDWLTRRDNDLARKRLSPKEHFAVLDQEIRKKFPEHFNGQQRPPAVESDGYNSVTPPKNSKKVTLATLSKEHRDTAENFERMGIMTKQQYLDDLIKHGDI